MILCLHDLEGDVIAVESTAILAVRLMRVEARPSLVTLISLTGMSIAVAETADEVLAAWRASRSEGGVNAHPAAQGWKFLPVVEGSSG